MSQVNPLVFGAVVLALVAATIFLPKLFAKPKGETADSIYVDSLRSVYDSPDVARPTPAHVGVVTPPAQTAVPAGAPRAASPVAAPPVPNSDPVSVAPPQGDGLAPLKLPAV